MRRTVFAIVCATMVVGAEPAGAQGHGPVFGLSTPTLRRGGWSLDNGIMGQVVGDDEMLMYRPMVSYGLTEHLQLSASLPVPLYTSQRMMPDRVATRMPASQDVELTLGWRFQARELGVGSRYESTAFVSLDYPVGESHMGLQSAPGIAAALATGYVSRGVYAWVGGMHRRYMSPIGATADHQGDVTMYSAVLGLRPPAFQMEYPHADWRLFIESVGEVTGTSVSNGVQIPSTGGHRFLVGPTLLGLFGGWGVSGGPLFPVYQRANGVQPREKVRFALDVVVWY